MNEELAALKREDLKLYARAKRAKTPAEHDVASKQHKQAREKLRNFRAAAANKLVSERSFKEENGIRSVTDENGKVWYVAYDVSTALGYKNAREAVPRQCPNRRIVSDLFPGLKGIKQNALLIPEEDAANLRHQAGKSWVSKGKQWFLYCIREKDTGNIKVGISSNPQSRLSSIQGGNSSELELVSCIPTDDPKRDEAAAHALLAEFHIHREWFEKEALALYNANYVE